MDDGEWDERHWGIISPLSRRLKEMSVGHREDTLNDLTDDQNVRRIHNMSAYAFSRALTILLTITTAKTLCTKLEKGEKHLEGVTEYKKHSPTFPSYPSKYTKRSSIPKTPKQTL